MSKPQFFPLRSEKGISLVDKAAFESFKKGGKSPGGLQGGGDNTGALPHRLC